MQLENIGIKILDVGCGTGILGAFFKKDQQCIVHGIEINVDAYHLARKNLDDVILGNVEEIDLSYERDYFDVIIMGDVLEHLINPLKTIQKLLSILKSEGRIYITVPNIRYWRTIIDLVFKDKWEYNTWGILDYTHLRFFTKTSIVKLFSDNNIFVEEVSRVIHKPSLSRKINLATFGLLNGFLASHVFIVVKK